MKLAQCLRLLLPCPKRHCFVLRTVGHVVSLRGLSHPAAVRPRCQTGSRHQGPHRPVPSALASPRVTNVGNPVIFQFLRARRRGVACASPSRAALPTQVAWVACPDLEGVCKHRLTKRKSQPQVTGIANRRCSKVVCFSETVRIGWVVKRKYTLQSRHCPSCRWWCTDNRTLFSAHTLRTRYAVWSTNAHVVTLCGCSAAAGIQSAVARTNGDRGRRTSASTPWPTANAESQTGSSRWKATRKDAKSLFACCFLFGLENAVSFLLAPLPRKRCNLMPSDGVA
jgi:hypothetical protein